MTKLRYRRWTGYVLEFAAICFGVTLSFMLNDWRERRSEIQTEMRSLQAIREDLRADSIAIEEELRMLAKMDSATSYFLSYGGRPEARLDSMVLAVQAFGTYTLLQFNTVGYEQLKQTGKLEIIRNQDLLPDLIALYTLHYDLAEEYNYIDKKLVLETNIPLAMEYLSIVGPIVGKASEAEERRVLRRLLEDPKFRNSLIVSQQFKRSNMNIYRQLLENIVPLAERIGRELKR